MVGRFKGNENFLIVFLDEIELLFSVFEIYGNQCLIGIGLRGRGRPPGGAEFHAEELKIN